MITNLKIGYGGRLGNQMFQYAMLLGVASKNNYQVLLPKKNSENIKEDGCLDISTGKWIQYRFLLNECFDMPTLSWMPVDQEKNIVNFSKEQFFHFDESIFNSKDFTSFDGYYQSYKYFNHILADIKREFVFKENIRTEAEKTINSISKGYDEIIAIHVRRGDYLGIPDVLPVCESEYYEVAMSLFCDKKYKWAVFSDDIQWCKESFGEDDSIYYSEGKNLYEDMCTMALCHHQIIANSTFSWWAAFLNTHTNKGIVAPHSWFGKTLINNDIKDLILPEWCKL